MQKDVPRVHKRMRKSKRMCRAVCKKAEQIDGGNAKGKGKMSSARIRMCEEMRDGKNTQMPFEAHAFRSASMYIDLAN